MDEKLLLYLGAALPLLWGIAHLLSTRAIARRYAETALDSQRIAAMAWIVEGAALIFIGVLVTSVTYLDRSSDVSQLVYRLAFVLLNALSVISLLTGFQVEGVPFRLSPLVFTLASLLILLGSITWIRPWG